MRSFDLFSGSSLGKLAPPVPDVGSDVNVVEILNRDDPDVLGTDGFPNIQTQKNPSLAVATYWKQWFLDNGYPDSAWAIFQLFTDWSFKNKYGAVNWYQVPKPSFPIESAPVSPEETQLHALYWVAKNRLEQYQNLPTEGSLRSLETAYNQYLQALESFQTQTGQDITLPEPNVVEVADTGNLVEPPGGVTRAGILDQALEYLKNPLVLVGLGVAGFLFLKKGKWTR